MRLSEKMQNKIADELQSRGASCTICGNKGMDLLSPIYSLHVLTEVEEKAQTKPLVALQCRECKHVMFFAAGQLGVPLEGLEDQVVT